MTGRHTKRWNLPLAVGFVACGVGVLFAEPTVLLLAVPPIVFAAYGYLAPAPTPTSSPSPSLPLELDRSIDADNPLHGQPVTITTAVRNTGTRPIFDLRIVDGVPRLLSVADGSARHTAILGPGEETTFSYTVTAKHGVHRFEPASVLVRNIAGTTEIEATLDAETELACRPSLETLPIDPAVRRRAGATATAARASGLEFAAVREYRRGDPMNRIDWNRFARVGDLTTVQFRDDRSVSVVLCLDARAACYRAREAGEPHAVAYGTAAAHAVLEAINDHGIPVGLAVMRGEPAWVPPAGGSRHVTTIRRTLQDREIVPVEPPDSNGRPADGSFEDQIRTLRERIDRGVSVVLCTPLVDDLPVDVARTLASSGRSVTVLSPDVTTTRSLGTDLARVRRANRIDLLRRSGIDVIDWRPDRSLEAAIQGQRRRDR
ncbi:DUF58 domain-containing protein [Halopiger thermotolerans]